MDRLITRFFPLLILFFLLACGRKDKKAAVISDPEDYYLDYQVNGEEGDDKLTVLVRFRNGEEGDAFLLPPGMSILLDNQPLEADSSKRTGGFYETHLAIDSFRGKHTLILKQADRVVHEQVFDFFPMEMEEEPGDSVSRTDLVFRLKGLQEEDYVRVIATDTAFYSEGINRLDTVQWGQLLISKADLEQLVNGPVQLILSREWETPLQQDGKGKGRLLVAYTLRREFTLKD